MRFATFLRQNSGAVAVEFAYVVPVMLTLLFCGYETSRLASAFVRLNDSAQMLADLVARQKGVTAAQITDFCNGVTMVMQPFPAAGFSATVASVTRTASGVTVDWQDASCGNGQPIASAAKLAEPYIPLVNNSVIVVRALYTYQPLVNNTVVPSVQIVKTGFSRVRSGASVARS